MSSVNKMSGTKKFVYFPFKQPESEQVDKDNQQDNQNITSDMLDKLLKATGREILREKTPSIQELEQTLREIFSKQKQDLDRKQNQTSVPREEQDNSQQSTKSSSSFRSNAIENVDESGLPIVTQLIQQGYLKDSQKWLSSRGFMDIGTRILGDVMKALKNGDFGLHETTNLGSGSIVLDTTKKYELGDDIRMISVSKSLLNTVQRVAKKNPGEMKIPLEIDVEDLEQYETMQDVRVSVVYCIDLSSTMRYSSMFGDMSRIEAAKRALWSLYLLNKKYFPSDSIYIVGFGALASKVAPQDIPYLKTFEPGSDFLHYTNYQAAFRLASKILQKDGAMNKRLVLVTDGHPSACFIDNRREQDWILSQRPYSHFYTPDKEALDLVKQNQDMTLDIASGQLVYLCYRYRQVDQYIGE